MRIRRTHNHYEEFKNTGSHSKLSVGAQNIQNLLKLTRRLSGTPAVTHDIQLAPRTPCGHFSQLVIPIVTLSITQGDIRTTRVH